MSINIPLHEEADAKTETKTLQADLVTETFGEGEPATDDLRVEGTVHANWSGVRSCGEQSRIDNALEDAVLAWVKQKLLEYINWTVVKYGHGKVKISVSNRTEPWPSNRRSCRGSLSAPVYIVLRKPS